MISRFNIVYLILILFRDFKNITVEGTVSQIFLFRPWFSFYLKIRETFSVIVKLFFLNFLKQKLGNLK